MSYVTGTLVTLPSGGFVSASVDGGGTGNLAYLRVQLYDTLRQPVGPAITIDSAITVFASGHFQGGRLGDVELTASPAGGFALAWESSYTSVSGNTSSGTEVVNIRTYSSTGVELMDGSLSGRTLSGVGASPVAFSNGGVALVTAGQLSSQYLDVLNANGALVSEQALSVTPEAMVGLPGAVVLSWHAGANLYQEVFDASGSILAPPTQVTVYAGTAAGEVLAGSSGPDSISGGAGDDTLYGGPGFDVLVGGAGADKFLISQDGSVDQLPDFNSAEGDRLLLLDSQGAIVPGANGLLIYDAASHALSWDADSDAGPALPVAVAVLPTAPNVQADFAAGFQPSALRVVTADGGRQETVFDWSGQSFDTATATYDAHANLLTYNVKFDSGATSNTSNDVSNSAEWSRVVAEYDPKVQLDAYSVYHDDGSRTLWLYDTTNAQPWSRVLEEYDPQGRLTQQSAALDNGTAWERHIDAADTQPWAYYIDNFKDGALLNHTYYSANGTVFG